MRFSHILTLSLAFSAFALLPHVAYAASPCACIVPASSSMGVIHQPKGEIIASGKYGFEQATDDMKVGFGSHLMTGLKSSATLDLGANCTIGIGGGSDVTIKPHSGGMACVEVTKSSLSKSYGKKESESSKKGTDAKSSGHDNDGHGKGKGKGKGQVASNGNGNHGNGHNGGSPNHGNNNPGHHGDGGHGHHGGHVGCGDHPISH